MTTPSRRRVLVVDDDKRFRAALVDLLTDVSGIEVVAAVGNAAEAIAVVQSRQVDVAVVDVQMPGRGGADVTRELIAAVPGIRVLALSAGGDPAARAHMSAAGAERFLVKGDGGLVDALLATHEPASGSS